MLRLSTTLIQEPPIHAYGRVYHNDGHLRLRDRKDTGASDRHGTALRYKRSFLSRVKRSFFNRV